MSFSEKTKNIGFDTNNAETHSEEHDVVTIADLAKNSSVEKPLEFKIDLEIPTKSAQLERDLRSYKGDFDSQREYLCRIDPNNLLTIFKSSIECDTILDIGKALNSGSEQWVKYRAEYLINFLYQLTKVDRFGMAIEFCSDSEKKNIIDVLDKIKAALDQKTQDDELDKKLSQIFEIFS
jgi:hypothetical protein